MRRIAMAGSKPLGVQYRHPWLMLTRSFRLALSPSVLALAFFGALSVSLGWWLSESVFLRDVTSASTTLAFDQSYLDSTPGVPSDTPCPLRCDTTSMGRAVSEWLGPWPEDPLTAVPYRMIRPFHALTRSTTRGAIWFYYLLGGISTAIAWSIFGLAIVRIAVVDFGRNEQVTFTQALRFAWTQLSNQVAAFFIPVVGIITVAVPLIVIGFLMRIEVIALLVSLLWVFFLPLGLMLALMAVGWLVGWPLMWGAIAADGSDSFDAVSRAYAYTLQRPLQYLFYTVVAAILGILGWGVVWYVSELLLDLTLWGIASGVGVVRFEQLDAAIGGESIESSMLQWSGHFIQFWQSVVRGIATSFASSYFWCAAAGIYLLLRYDTDDTELDEVAMPVTIHSADQE